ncbi:MAG: glutamate--tRNA ligase [Elusimicrobiota bacterium]|jgi:glutamyl-tRNA synthetase|nr:glutamate--tRNA ligase [Elusimicrobiota bacterium]
MNNVRVRFAPSPTGDLHIGGVRTALFNYLFAKNQGGTFVLRIEDTDEARSTDASTQVIIDALKWLKLDWGEGPGNEPEKYAPYYQMKRKNLGIYQKYIDELLDKNLAYPCYCAPEEVEQMRKLAQLQKKPPKYDGHCSNLAIGQRQELEKQGRKPVIRFRMPKDGKMVLDDIIRGKVEFDNALLDDFVIAKANGVPTYNFACVIDDHLMDMTHIIRGDDHVSNTPRQLHLYQAFGWDLPKFAHTAMIMGSDGARLSKRHGHTSVLDYQKEGYLAEALLNYLALLGWSTSDSQQIFTMKELEEKFSLEGCGGSSSTFDPAKLLWLNGEKIRSKSIDEAYSLFMDWIKYTNNEKIIDGWDKEVLKKAMELEHDKIKTLSEIPNLVDFFFVKEVDYKEEAVQKVFLSDKSKDSAKIVINECSQKLENQNDFSASALEQFARDLAEQKGLKTGQVFHPIRVAVSGRTQGPSLFHLMELLGKNETNRRIKIAKDRFFK